jgi:hypothetical protein
MADSITPPQDLRDKWLNEAPNTSVYDYLIDCAARWGADRELEACCHEVQNMYSGGSRLRAARHPNPPSLKGQALNALSRAYKDALTNPLTGEVVALRTILSKEQSDTIRRALEALPND